ncbi:hypothetical protein AB0D91_05425 [Streptomyces canus]|uniref:hypothetical protein n=1 Tax=Streptomyces canus TaxID=58343 RepID=UPI00340618E6
MTQPDPTAAVWIDGDPLMEAIASTLWEHCARDDKDMPQAVCDDPRTIAAWAAAAMRSWQSAELARAQAEAHQYRTALQGVARRAAVLLASVDRADVLRELADLAEGCDGHLTKQELRRMAREADRSAAELRRVAAETREVVHGCPPDGSGLTPCCGRTPFELPRTDRMSTDPAAVTCTPPAGGAPS